MFSPSRKRIDEVYASLWEDFKIEDNGELNNYIEVELDRRPHGSIHISQPYLIQRILKMIPGMERSSSKTTPVFNPPPTPAKNEGAQARNN